MQSLWRKLGFLLTALALSIAFCLPARAYQEQSSSESPTHITEYKAYMAALDAGDRDAAARHSKAAWEAAEQALGDHQLTAILAFNYAQQVFISDPEAALIALRRADALVQIGLVELPETELRLYTAYAEYAINDRSKEARALREALIAAENLNPDEVTMDEASMWFLLSQRDMIRKNYRRAIESADEAEAIINNLDPDNVDFMMRVLLIRGVAKLMPTPLSTDDIIDSHFDLDRAYWLPPPQKDFESFDPTFARIIAWHATTYSVMASMAKYEPLKSSSNGPRPIFETDIDAPEDCGIEWETRIPPKYPRKELANGYIGAVIVIFDISDTGNILHPRILSEVPTKKFSKIVLQSAESWRIKTMPIDHPSCRLNLRSVFAFTLRP
ncbi:MAG: hypothetical protein GXP04_05995 [Alphaproteobacteria bacterium]|nr:hypothetical protein [Alphaproteobacteria bacterium]